MAFNIFDALERIGHKIERSEYAQQIQCPFHSGGNEINLSARVYPETDSIYCFTCAQSWNPVALVAEAEGIEYQAAKRLILGIYGGWKPSKARNESIDAQLADLILAASRLRKKKEAAEEGLHDILYSAASGDPPWEIEEAIHSWARQYFPRLMQ